MQIASHEIEAAGFLLSPVLIVVAVVVWLLLATGTAGRVVQYLEELPHLRAAKAVVGSSRTPVGLHRDRQSPGPWATRRPAPITPSQR